MYKHILLPTDGSRLSEQAAAAGVALARSLGARVTVLHVLPRRAESALEAWAHQGRGYAAKLDEALHKRAEEYLDSVRELAMRAGVACECAIARGETVHAGILAEAAARGCDLILMASHGRSGETATVLGSETVKVATLGRVPVLVHHAVRAKASGRGKVAQRA